MYIIVGLGNPGEEYKNTRHNVGRMIVESFAKNAQKFAEKCDTKKAAKQTGFEDFSFNKKYNAQCATGEINGEKTMLLLPETFMNKSGKALETLITSVKKAEKLVVVHDDLDLSIGRMKILFNRGSGGHKGLESIVRTIKTEAFTRLKVGICPTTPTGKPKKPTGDKLLDFIVGPFKPAEIDEIKDMIKQASESLYVLVNEGREKAMSGFNS
ncbi:MAG: aminoacyl-tRNA hydrolase [Candidatus Pacebacteria bacterium]|nr:aminoacyl-tRNA hydrolase [Candidatus Paceibacterota bacterium]MBP9818946.1 aminoacyl-tRNA hydrolase [Candidatus Paceibacterota bacterium]